MKKSIVIGLLLSYFIFMNGCGKVQYANIPDVNVNITINVLDPLYADLQAPGGYAVVDGGVKGIVIYRVDIDRFNAYERMCPYDIGDCGKVSVDNTNVVLHDDDCGGAGCGSKFNIIDGSVLNGPANLPLKQYSAAFDGMAILTIIN